METLSHDPVMVDEILHVLELKPGAIVVDGTIGLAGHALRISELIAPGGILYGFDWDQAMLSEAERRLKAQSRVEFRLINKDFRNLGAVLEKDNVVADGILLDLGLNSAQIDDPSRGISFKHEAPLDMRFDRSKGATAADLLNTWPVDKLEDCFFNLSDEKWARAIAKKIVERRKERPLQTTTDLVECVLAAVPTKARETRIHPATRVFQAIRLAVSGELDNLEGAIGDAADHLAPGGTLAVLSYHSGEDRAAKLAFQARNRNGFSQITRKPSLPSPGEIARNPRSRSAKLRVLRRDKTSFESHGRDSHMPFKNGDLA